MNKSQSVLMPIGSFYPAQCGGPSNTMYWICQELSHMKINVKVISTDRGLDDAYTSDIWHSINGINVIYCSNKFVYFRELIRELDRASVIHLNSLFYWRSLLCYIISLLSRKEIIWSVRGELHQRAMINRNFLKTLVLRFLRLSSIKVRFHGTSMEEMRLISKNFPKNSRLLVPNYIPIRPKKIVEKKGQILYLGRLNRIKNIEFLIETYLKCKFDEKIELIIAGLGEKSYVNKLKSLIPESYEGKIQFIGEIKGLAKEKLIVESSILALPSFSENFGNVVLEALSHGTPVVCSVHTPWEQLVKYNCGYHLELVESKWIKVLETHMNNRKTSKIRNMGSRAFEFSNSYFNIKTGVQDWIDAYGGQNYK